ncbi:hypothetical protein ACFGVR_03025 [Mucilaginibacter sp. AW1-3]
MKDQKIEDQSKVYLFDLINTALENGFKSDEKWELGLVNEEQKIRIQKDYSPAIASKVLPEILLQVYHVVKAKLNQTLNSEEQLLDMKQVLSEKLNYIVAYIPARQRK